MYLYSASSFSSCFKGSPWISYPGPDRSVLVGSVRKRRRQKSVSFNRPNQTSAVPLKEVGLTGSEETVARDVFSSVDAFEQEAVLCALGHAQVGHDGRDEVGREGEEDGHAVALGPVLSQEGRHPLERRLGLEVLMGEKRVSSCDCSEGKDERAEGRRERLGRLTAGLRSSEVVEVEADMAGERKVLCSLCG